MYSVAFSPNSTQLASAYRKTIKIWDVSSGVCLRTLESHNKSVNCVAYSPDSTRLASTSWDRTIKIWDAGSGACIQTLETGRTFSSITFDITGSYLYTDRGTLVINTPSASKTTAGNMECLTPQWQGVGLSEDGYWITYNSENVVWLPSEYRPGRSAVAGWRGMIGIGTDSGKVWMCVLDLAGIEQVLSSSRSE